MPLFFGCELLAVTFDRSRHRPELFRQVFLLLIERRQREPERFFLVRRISLVLLPRIFECLLGVVDLLGELVLAHARHRIAGGQHLARLDHDFADPAGAAGFDVDERSTDDENPLAIDADRDRAEDAPKDSHEEEKAGGAEPDPTHRLGYFHQHIELLG